MYLMLRSWRDARLYASSSSGRFMAWIHFTQGEAFDYIPLKLGLGYLKETDFPDKHDLYYYSERAGWCVRLCAKLYTTRLRPLKPHLTYIVVKGRRGYAKPVEPKIEFRVRGVWELHLRSRELYSYDYGEIRYGNEGLESLTKDDLTFPELDLGFTGATFEDLVEELLGMNKKAALDTPFYINRLIPTRDPALQ